MTASDVLTAAYTLTTGGGNMTWTAVDITNDVFGNDGIYGVAYGNDKWVAVGNNGKTAYSSDGTEWTAVGDSKLGSRQINGVAYGGTGAEAKFVAVGNGKMAYCAD
jgi:hypothetical protein